ncbi:MAG: helix-turn-helix domain-containing protein, partial [Mesorhizobium sp.]
ALAQFERETLSQRTREGLAAARRRGAVLGRPPKLNANQLQRARKRIARGETTRDVAYDLKVAPWTLRRALHRVHDNKED